MLDMSHPDKIQNTRKPSSPDSSEAAIPAADYLLLFESVPDPCLVLDPAFRIVSVNEAYLRVTMTKREEILGRGIFEVFPDNPSEADATGVRNLSASLNRVLANRAPDSMALQRYDIRKPEAEGGGFEERYWSPINTPVIGADGSISYIIHRAQDVTEFVRFRQPESGLGTRIEMPGQRAARAQWFDKRRTLIAVTGFLVGAAVLFFIGWLGYRHLTDMKGVTSIVIHTYQEIGKLNELLTDILDAETGQRGFIITGERTFLTPYVIALGAVEQDLASLKSLAANKPEQQKRLANLEAIVREKLAVLRTIIVARETEGYQAAQALVLIGRSKMLTDQIRAQIAEATKLEMDLLQKLYAQQESETRKLNRVLLAGAILAATLLCAIFMVLMKEISRRGRAEGELLSQHKKLYQLLDDRMRTNEELAKQRAQLEEAKDRLEAEAAERIRVQELLRATNADLKRSNQDLEMFASVTSHDLQEPLHTITSYIELLAHRYKDKLDEKANLYIDYVVDGADHMHLLINDLLAYSRVGTRAKPFGPVRMDLALDQALGSLRKSIAESGATVEREELPEVEGDDTQLAQLFQNLIGNAIKFKKNELPLRIRVSAQRTENDWVFGVHDNGIGIEPRFFERIFGIFQRLHTREEYEGSGIGLAICRKIVVHHGGRIWVESTFGEGTSFYFTLPLRGESHGA